MQRRDGFSWRLHSLQCLDPPGHETNDLAVADVETGSDKMMLPHRKEGNSSLLLLPKKRVYVCVCACMRVCAKTTWGNIMEWVYKLNAAECCTG
eukprot:1154426-Pelagomonas_calceolata.AAC.4